jgi:hypothetical protein
MPEEHARLSASGSKKWLNCPGSVRLEEKFADEGSSYAAEGTTAHALAELKLLEATGQITKKDFVKRASGLETDAEMDEYTEGYKDYVLERFAAVSAECPDAKLSVEERLELSEYVPDGFGTGDAVIVGFHVLEIIDLKYGKGVPVSARDNSQLMLYALGALTRYDWLYDVRKVRMHIYQPRIDNVDVCEKDAEELYMWGAWVKQRAKLALKKNAECAAGDYCDSGFCKARPVCRAYNDEKQRLAYLDFKPPAELSDEEIAEIIGKADELAKWAKLVSDYALDSAVNHGARYPGFKLVEGRSCRTYTDEAAVAERLESAGCSESDITVKKLKGITDMEKLLGKKRFAELLDGLIVKPAGKPVLVPETDKRPELNTTDTAKADFEDIINGGNS